MIRVLRAVGSWILSGRLLTIVAIVGCYALGIFGNLGVAENSVLLAYDIDLQMDKARVEKTVEHYGEPVRDIVEQAHQNNENNPDRKSTAENTYKRETALNEALPEQLGRDFSKQELKDME